MDRDNISKSTGELGCGRLFFQPRHNPQRNSPGFVNGYTPDTRAVKFSYYHFELNQIRRMKNRSNETDWLPRISQRACQTKKCIDITQYKTRAVSCSQYRTGRDTENRKEKREMKRASYQKTSPSSSYIPVLIWYCTTKYIRHCTPLSFGRNGIHIIFLFLFSRTRASLSSSRLFSVAVEETDI